MVLAFFILFVSAFPYASSAPPPKYKALFCFGDSYSDTGNYNILAQGKIPYNQFEHLPYGITYFGHPTGRATDGRVPLDFIAEALGLPHLLPSLSTGQDFRKGANFAVSGATALDLSFFQQNQVSVAAFTISLNVQIRWFQDLKPSLCNTTRSCNDYLSKALFILGEIGGNDYFFMMFSNKTVDYVRSYVPTVINTINAAAEVLLKQGVTQLMLPGLGQIGCTPIILTLFPSSNRSDYDTSGCLRKYNTIATYHSQLLTQAVRQLRARFPQARIIFADYYGPEIAALQTPELFGFTNGAPLKVCCGSGGGPYNFNVSAFCGQPGVMACENPSAYLNWDGIHMTEAAYSALANVWLRGPFADPPILGPL